MLKILEQLAPFLKRAAEQQEAQKVKIAEQRRLIKKYKAWRKKRRKVVKASRRHAPPKHRRKHRRQRPRAWSRYGATKA